MGENVVVINLAFGFSLLILELFQLLLTHLAKVTIGP